MILRKISVLLLIALFIGSCSVDADAEIIEEEIAMEDSSEEESDMESSEEDGSSDEGESTEEDSTDSEEEGETEDGEESSEEESDGTSDDNTDEESEMTDDETMEDEGESDEEDTTEEDTTEDENTEDDDTMGTNDSPLLGLWVLSELRIADDVDDDDLNFARQIVDFLVERECDVATFEFMSDGTVQSENKANFIRPNAGPTGITVDCPDESDMATAMWTLDGNQLSFINEMQEEVILTVSFEDEDTLIIPGATIDANNFAGADAVFVKRQ